MSDTMEKSSKVPVRFLRSHFPAPTSEVPRPTAFKLGQVVDLDRDEAENLATYAILEILKTRPADGDTELEQLRVGAKDARERLQDLVRQRAHEEQQLDAARDEHAVRAANARIQDLQPETTKVQGVVAALEYRLEQLTGSVARLANEIVTSERRLRANRVQLDEESQRLRQRGRLLDSEERQIDAFVKELEAMMGKEAATEKLRELRNEAQSPAGAGFHH